MSFKCGLVGLPNVGKSTLFNLLTKLKVASDNFPFCTIEPNFGMVPIYDPRLHVLSEIVSTKKIIFTYIEFIDIAGLVKQAHLGEGLGNKFLSHIRDTDVIMHVVRCFKDDNIVHVYGKVQPIDDIEIINCELILSDFEICKKRLNKLQKECFLNDYKIQKEILILKRCMLHLEKNESLRTLIFSIKDLEVISYLNFLTIKPMVFVINKSVFDHDNIGINDVLQFASDNNIHTVSVSLNFSDNMSSVQPLKYDDCSGIKNVPLAGYKALNLVTFFTVGSKEIRAWTTRNTITINQSVKCIHTDLSKGFIRARVFSYLDFIKYKGEQGSKKHGKMRIEGKKYFINDGDIINVLYKI